MTLLPLIMLLSTLSSLVGLLQSSSSTPSNVFNLCSGCIQSRFQPFDFNRLCLVRSGPSRPLESYQHLVVVYDDRPAQWSTLSSQTFGFHGLLRVKSLFDTSRQRDAIPGVDCAGDFSFADPTSSRSCSFNNLATS